MKRGGDFLDVFYSPKGGSENSLRRGIKRGIGRERGVNLLEWIAARRSVSSNKRKKKCFFIVAFSLVFAASIHIGIGKRDWILIGDNNTTTMSAEVMIMLSDRDSSKLLSVVSSSSSSDEDDSMLGGGEHHGHGVSTDAELDSAESDVDEFNGKGVVDSHR